MKKIVCHISLLSLLACGPKLKTTVKTTYEALPNDALVVVLALKDNPDINGIQIGELKATDGGLTSECSYYENIQNFKAIARKSGANLIKITQHKTPDKWSTCHRIWATMYKVDLANNYETSIRWSENRKLTWDDFKGTPDTEKHPNTLALTNSGFGFEPSAFNIFKDGQLFIEATMNTYKSWVLPSAKNNYVLRHEQIHFDITEIFSRKLRKTFQENNLKSSDYLRAKEVFEAIFEECRQFQERYDEDTKKGERRETQEKWEAIVEIELAKYDAYKN
ncbi:MAG: hypothetical protein ED556_06385 [Winogradskyella sp.]|uniref:hypothetical protein n=1 Tax=Winogradskyella sp. TaxID=1883156 RepID=UPI000F3B66AB|nr:hypothetical protein [Winogradskyella sp.]RNC87047.1 MAG: hypothetical protein ED556_06385 [Winogradskyella sp.]